MSKVPLMRKLGLIAALLGVFSLLSFTALIFALRSPGMQQAMMQSLREPLLQAGLTAEFARFELDLFGDLTIEQLQLKIQREPLIKGGIKLRSLRVSYKLWPLLQKKLVIKAVQLQDLQGQLDINLPASPSGPEKPLDLKSLLATLRQPPLTLESPEIDLHVLDLSLNLSQASLKTALQIKGATIKAQANVLPGRLTSFTDLTLPLQVVLQSADQNAAMQSLELDLVAKAKLSFDLVHQDKNFDWKLDASALSLDLIRLHGLKNPGQIIDLQHFQWSQKLALQHSLAVPANPELNDLLFPLQVDHDQTLQLAKLLIKQQDGQILVQDIAQHSKAKIDALHPQDLGHTNWQFLTKLGIGSFERVTSKPAETLKLPLLFTLQTDAVKGIGKAQSSLQIISATLPGALHKATLDQQLQADFSWQDRKLSMQSEERLEHLNLSRWSLHVQQDSPKSAAIDLNLKLSTHPEWIALHPVFTSLSQLAFPQLDWRHKLTLQSPKDLDQLTAADHKILTITNEFAADVRPTAETANHSLSYKAISLNGRLNWLRTEVQSFLDINLDSLHHPALKRKLKIAQHVELNGKVDDKLQGRLKQQLLIDGRQVFEQGLQLEDDPRQANLRMDGLLSLPKEFAQLAQPLDILSKTEGLKLQFHKTLALKHAYTSLTQVPAGWDPLLQPIDVLSEIRILSPGAAQPDQQLIWRQPIGLDTRVLANHGRAKATLRLLIPDFELKNKARLAQLKMGSMIEVKNIKNPQSLVTKTVVQLQSIEPLGPMADRPELKELLKNLQLIVHADLLNQRQLRLHRMFAGLQHPLLQFHASGETQLGGVGAFDARIEAVMPQTPKVGLKGSGRMLIPIRLNLFEAKKLSIQARPQFEHLSFELGDLKLRDLDGRFELLEELSIDNQGHIGFMYLENQNPFVRVDYEEVEPYLPQDLQITLKSMEYKHIKLGPLVESIELRQNLLRMNQLKADLLGGSISGRFYFDMHPERLQLGFLGRFSELHPEWLKETTRQQKNRLADVLSGRLGLNFEVEKRLAVGRVDVTKLGQSQVLSLFDVIDPEYKDPQLGHARKALLVAYPRSLSLVMQQGLMDMDLQLGGVIPQSLSIRSLPLSSLISAYAGEALQKLETTFQAGRDSP